MRLLKLLNLWPPFGSNRTRPAGLRQAIAHILAADSDLADLIGDRIYYAAIPSSETQSAIAYQVIGRNTPGDLDGPNSIGWALIQIGAIGRDSDELEAITDTLRRSFDGFSGDALGWTFHDAIPSERDTWTPPSDGTDTGTLRTIVDFRFQYTSP